MNATIQSTKTERPEACGEEERTVWPRLFTVPDVARILSLSRATVYKLIYSGELPTVRIGRSRRIAAEDLDNWVQGLRERSLALLQRRKDERIIDWHER